jgi:palmitoyltransferase
MSVTSLKFAFVNSTSIEELNRKHKVWQMAVAIPEHMLNGRHTAGSSVTSQPNGPMVGSYKYVTFGGNARNSESSAPNSSIDGKKDVEKVDQRLPERTFALLRTPPGANPWSISPLENFKDVMGKNVIEWLLPLTYSPCSRHDRSDSQFTLGSVVDQLRKEAGIWDRDLGHPASREIPEMLPERRYPPEEPLENRSALSLMCRGSKPRNQIMAAGGASQNQNATV